MLHIMREWAHHYCQQTRFEKRSRARQCWPLVTQCSAILFCSGPCLVAYDAEWPHHSAKTPGELGICRLDTRNLKNFQLHEWLKDDLYDTHSIIINEYYKKCPDQKAHLWPGMEGVVPGNQKHVANLDDADTEITRLFTVANTGGPMPLVVPSPKSVAGVGDKTVTTEPTLPPRLPATFDRSKYSKRAKPL